MTTAKARAERRQARRRAEILQIACGQVAGSGSVSLRGVGRSIDVTAPGLYRYYPDAAALELAVAREVLVSALAGVGDEGWDGYARWAAGNPNLFAFLAKPQHTALLAELHAAASRGAVWGLHQAVTA